MCLISQSEMRGQNSSEWGGSSLPLVSNSRMIRSPKYLGVEACLVSRLCEFGERDAGPIFSRGGEEAANSCPVIGR